MGSFWRARLGTILAVAPLGVWTLVHLWNNLYAFAGADEWERSVTQYPNPIAHAITVTIVLAPLLYHTAWGINRIAIGRPNNVEYKNYSNLKFLLQRVSAIGVMLFLGAHIFLAMLNPRMKTGHAETFADISHEMHHHMPTLIVYLLGTLGVAYHLANGLQTAAMKFGLRWPRSMSDRLEWPFLLFGGLVLGLAWASIYALYVAGA